jgi:cellulose synthase/poly-beta-1,6-N-acetylglucosamine synthase-like glycosyltransferase
MLFPTHWSWDFFSVIFLIFLFFVAIQLSYVVFIFLRLAFFKEKKTVASTLMPISIIIAARNESDNLYDNLPFILTQDYPEFEVIIVNNQSVDDSTWLLKALCLQHKNLKVVEISKNKHLLPGKKLPITLGVKAAKYEKMVFTDADCKPASNQWLRIMSETFTEKNQIVLGYAPYFRTKGIINRIIRYDTAFIGVSYLSFALAKMPYMGVGRNLAYTKKVFESVRGFKSHYSLPSGDDDLFIQEAAVNQNYTIQISPETFCYSKAAETWKGWVRQKTRHYSTSSRYKVIKKALLGIYPISLLLVWLTFVILLFNVKWFAISLILFGCMLIVKWLIQGKCLRTLNEKGFALAFPLWDLGHALLMPMLYNFSDHKRYKKW